MFRIVLSHSRKAYSDRRRDGVRMGWMSTGSGDRLTETTNVSSKLGLSVATLVVASAGAIGWAETLTAAEPRDTAEALDTVVLNDDSESELHDLFKIETAQ